jgi:hypothetical protein
MLTLGLVESILRNQADRHKCAPDQPGDVDDLQESRHFALGLEEVAQPLEPVVWDVHPCLPGVQQAIGQSDVSVPLCMQVLALEKAQAERARINLEAEWL